MESMVRNPWEIEDILYDIGNISGLLGNFKVYDDSKITQKIPDFKFKETDDFIKTLENSTFKTGIMISTMRINDTQIFILILDNTIFIISYINLHKFVNYFKGHFKCLIFFTLQIKEYIERIISLKFSFSEQIDHIFNDQETKNQDIKSEIIRFIIKKSQYRTLNMRHELLPNKYKIFNNYSSTNFIEISIMNSNIEICYNSEEQILNVLKIGSFHENLFYEEIENSFPFICKIFGQIQSENKIVLEYIEGERLDDFILKNKEINFSTKMKIILEILFSVYYIHSNGIYLRDLKPDNIMIDSEYNAFLIDFNYSKEINSQNEQENTENIDNVKNTENTGNIGNYIYAAPEQLNSNNYSYKVDLYSIGMIIHFIITGKEYEIEFNELTKIYENKENISDNDKFPKCQKEIEFILNYYKKCFEISPELRPIIPGLIVTFTFDYGNNKMTKYNKSIIPILFDQLMKYDCVFKINNKYEVKESIELSYLKYFFGENYYVGIYISQDINKAIHYFTLSSNKNNSYAQCLLGEIYYFDIYIPRDINKAIHYFTLSSNQNNSYAQRYLGQIYYDGEYASRDINKAIYYFTLSSNQDDSWAQYYLGKIYYDGEYTSRNINKSIYYLILSSNQNNSNAQYLLGEIYLDKYFLIDINKSIHYLTLTANQNHSYAQCLLGIIYYRGECIPRDMNKAIHYLTLSSNQNNSEAQDILGLIYYEGRYTLRDINKAIHYFTLSSNQNNPYSQYLLGEIYYYGEYISQDINKAIHYFTLSSNQNDSNAQFYLGIIYYCGKYISQDINKAIHYLTLSSNQNHPYSQYLLGEIYYKGKYIQRDIKKSIYYLTLSSNQNNSDAQYYLGNIYYEGKYIQRDIKKSIHYLTLSSNKNNSKAQCLLGVIYYDNKYIEKDIKKSIHYLKEASCFYDEDAKNLLGIIYKNGDGVEKNIYFATIYFNEAIKQKNDSYSMYNLARIYYFGIELERDIPKSIELLKKASENRFSCADLFLYYIYSNCDIELYLNEYKSLYYKNKFMKKNSNFSQFFFQYIYYAGIQALHQFFKEYDLFFHSNCSFDLHYFLTNGKFYEYDWRNPIDKPKNMKKSLRKDIDDDFYKGFYGEN